MQTNVNYVSKNYYVNTKKNTVCCVLDYSINFNDLPFSQSLKYCSLFTNYINKLLNQSDNYYYDSESNCFIFQTVGIATCMKDDKFDEVFGKKIALTRAQQYAFSFVKKFYEDIENILYKMSEKYSTLKLNSFLSKCSCTNHVKDLINTKN